jgi:hypothetical protein
MRLTGYGGRSAPCYFAQTEAIAMSVRYSPIVLANFRRLQGGAELELEAPTAPRPQKVRPARRRAKKRR